MFYIRLICEYTVLKTLIQNYYYALEKQLENLSWEVINLCERRRKAKINLLNHPDDAEKQIEYRKLKKTVTKLIQKQKRENLQNKIMTLEEDLQRTTHTTYFEVSENLKGKTKIMYVTKRLAGSYTNEKTRGFDDLADPV